MAVRRWAGAQRSGCEELAERVEFVEAPFGGGGQALRELTACLNQPTESMQSNTALTCKAIALVTFRTGRSESEGLTRRAAGTRSPAVSR